MANSFLWKYTEKWKSRTMQTYLNIQAELVTPYLYLTVYLKYVGRQVELISTSWQKNYLKKLNQVYF